MKSEAVRRPAVGCIVWLGRRVFLGHGGNQNAIELSGTRMISRWGIADHDGVLRNAFGYACIIYGSQNAAGTKTSTSQEWPQSR
jgi:hypothetical protein